MEGHAVRCGSRLSGSRRPRALVGAAALAGMLGLVPVRAHAAGLGELLGSVNALVGSSHSEVRALAVYQANCVRVQAAAGTEAAAGGLAGLLTALTGRRDDAGAMVTYGEYQAGASVGGAAGLASVTDALRSLLAGRGS